MTERDSGPGRALLVFAIIALIGLVPTGYAQSLVNPSWLAERLDESAIVVLHVGTQSGYASGHLPNARLITLEDVIAPESLPGVDRNGGNPTDLLLFEMNDVDSLTEKLESLGITDGSQIVLYSESDQPLAGTTRIAFVLDYLGLGDNVRLLNGGMDAWIAAGNEITNVTPTIPSGVSLRLQTNDALIADSSEVAAITQGSENKLIDARAMNFYNGEQESFGGFGHIAGAVNLPFSSLVDDSGRFDEELMIEAFSTAGISQDDELIVYCHVGLRATQVIFAAKLMGIDARLYDGSFQDWVARDRGEVEQ